VFEGSGDEPGGYGPADPRLPDACVGSLTFGLFVGRDGFLLDNLTGKAGVDATLACQTIKHLSDLDLRPSDLEVVAV